MKRFFLLTLGLLATTASLKAQTDDFKMKLYGFVRGDLFYNSRANVESFDGTFLLFPADKQLDANGADLNAVSNSGLGMITTRLGLDIAGPRLLGAESSAKIEGDFAGFSSSHTMIRIRQAYIKFKWDRGSSLLLGQTWHPLFGDVIPRILNVSTGAPFQPFSRTPQINYQYHMGNISLTGAALFQSQFVSSGPNGKSSNYSRNAVIPEFYAGVNYHTNDLLLAAGVDILTIKPRTQASINGKTYKVDESLTTTSFMLSGRYTKDLWMVAAKSTFGRNLSNVTMLGGYAVSDIDPENGRQSYTPFKNLSSWLNITYGKEYRGGIFLGHSKSMGTVKEKIRPNLCYGQGINIDKLLYASAEFSYNTSILTLGLEYSLSSAHYGDISSRNGKITNTHAVNNHRVLGLITYFF